MKEQPATWTRRVGAAGPAALALLMFALAQVRSSGDRVVIWSDVLFWVVMIGAVVWWFVLVSRLQRGYAGGCLRLAISGSCIFMCFGFGLIEKSLERRAYAEVTAPDGTTYAALIRGFMDHDFELARRGSNWGAFATYDVLAAPNNRPIAAVRPAGLGERRDVVVRNGRVALFRYATTRCDAAIDTGGRLLVGALASDAPTPAPSPFFLIGPDDKVDESDVAALVEEFKARDESTDHLPTDAVLSDALGSSNPSVRDAAARFVRAGGSSIYPEATKRLP